MLSYEEYLSQTRANVDGVNAHTTSELNAHEARMQDTMDRACHALGGTINRAAANAAARTVRETRESERRLSNQIGALGGSWTSADWALALILAVLGAAIGFVVDLKMVKLCMPPWVYQQTVYQQVTDAYGNVTGITSSTTSPETIWVMCVLWVVGCAILGFTLGAEIRKHLKRG